jgi:hypothetical protein
VQEFLQEAAAKEGYPVPAGIHGSSTRSAILRESERKSPADSNRKPVRIKGE